MLNRDATILVVIDLQERLLAKIPAAEAVIGRTVDLIRFARELHLPLLWAEQYPKGLGPTAAAVARELHGLRPLAKRSFGCLGDPEFEAALRDSQRSQLLVAGVETHVCVMQTVLQAVNQGYEVYVAQDAVAARVEAEHEAGIARMASGGACLVTAEMAMFELLGQAGTAEFKRVLPLLK